MSFNADYIDVATRIAEFREQYPDGSLQPANPDQPYRIEHLAGSDRNGEKTVEQTFIVYVAAAYRHPDDPRPGIGVAYEVFPGRTNFTRGSELMNAETSAWGRAIIATLAADSRKGVASAEEVRNRKAEREESGLPRNRDGSISRSRVSQEDLERSGNMTREQLREHNRLAKDVMANPKKAERAETVPDDDPWYATGGDS